MKTNTLDPIVLLSEMLSYAQSVTKWVDELSLVFNLITAGMV